MILNLISASKNICVMSFMVLKQELNLKLYSKT